MNTLIVIILVSVVFWKLKNYFLERTNLEYEFKFKNIALKLDLVAIDYSVYAHDPRYKNMSQSILNMINNLSNMSLTYFILYLLVKRKSLDAKKKSIPKTPTKSLKDLKLEVELARINKEFYDTLFDYLLQKAVFLKIVLLILFWFRPFKHAVWNLKDSMKGIFLTSNNTQFEFPFAINMS